jgi:hypothetical protein
VRYLILGLLFPLTVSAQQTAYKAVMCADTEKVITALTGKDYKEKPFWMGVDQKDHTYSIFYNKETTGWTIIEFKGKTACILGAGEESQLSQDLLRKNN